MRGPTRREFGMLALLGVVAIGLLYFGEGNILSGGTAVDVEPSGELDEAPVVYLSRLGLDPEGYNPQGRDLFKYGPPPRVHRPVPPPVVRQPTVRPQRQPPKPQVRPPAPKVDRAPVGPRPPKPDFKYLGFLGPKGNRIFVFADGEDLMLARVGETVQQEFKVVEFKYEAVVMGYTDERFTDMTTELTWN